MKLATIIVALGMVLGTKAVAAPPSGMVLIPDGSYRGPRSSSEPAQEISVRSYYLDVLPVTNGEFLEFVQANPQWRRSPVKRLFADEGYLKEWSGDLDLGSNVLTNAPVTSVSWFAAKAFCAWKGKRLPTTAEWELAAAASPSQRDGTKDEVFKKAIVNWYSKPAAEKHPPVASGRANFFGVHDLHGLIWEWTADFNAELVTGDPRGANGLDGQLFCGAGAQGARDTSDFPAFLRAGFRSSLKADYTVHTLGFRCAKDL